MPNGRLHRINPKTGKQYPPKRLTNYKKQVKLAEGLEVAKLKGSLRFKKTLKGIELSAREHIGKLIDKLEPLELVACLGLTLIVKKVIDESEVLRGKLKQIAKPAYGIYFVPPEDYVGPPQVGTPSARPSYRVFYPGPRKTEEAAEAYEGLFPDWADWLISFAIAYCIIKHGGQLLGLMKEGMGTMTSVVGALLGVGAA